MLNGNKMNTDKVNLLPSLSKAYSDSAYQTRINLA